ERYLHDEFTEQALQVIGRAAALAVDLRDRVRHRAAGDLHLDRAEVFQVTADGRLRRDDSFRLEELHELGLARHRLILQHTQDAVLTLGSSEGDHQYPS